MRRLPGRDTILYGGNTTCLEARFESGETVIIDAGTVIRRLGDALGIAAARTWRRC